MTPAAPTAAELEANLVVRAAFAAAWADSFPDDPALRHEEGGFIYADVTTGEVTVRRAGAEILDELNLSLTARGARERSRGNVPHAPQPGFARVGSNSQPRRRARGRRLRSAVFVISEMGVHVVGPD